MEPLNDKRLRVAGLLIQNLIFFLFFYLKRILDADEPVLKVIAWQVGFTLVMWESTRLAVRFCRTRYKGLQYLSKRLFLLSSLLVLLAILIGCWHVWMENLLGFWKPEDLNKYTYLYSIGMTLFFCQLIGVVYESIYYLQEWKKSVREAEELKKRNLQSQLESLKNQVSPHFLFNSLNSLSALIEEDPKRAVRFVDELSLIYRYLLQSNEKDLISLGEELAFIQAYYYLLKTRFEKGLFLFIEVLPEFHSWLIPPLTLQMLVENAVKHNIIAETMPLHIRIYTLAQQSLVVENNLQKRKTTTLSNKMGLSNVSAKYGLLSQAEVLIRETESTFQIQIPLINPQ